jgi:hypothetical protein
MPYGTVIGITQGQVLQNGQVLIQFQTVSGDQYLIQYSYDQVTWKTVVPTVPGTGNWLQWIDNGPPKTESEPQDAPPRFYRIWQEN